jgi:hypothetical protein
MIIKAPKDFLAGLMFLVIAAIAVLEARNYSFGTATKMGPGYFPVALGLVLGALGALLMLRSLVITGEKLDGLQWRPLGTLVLAIVGFGLIVTKLGLAVSLTLVTFASAFAYREVKLREAFALSIFIASISVLIFVYGLRMQLPIWPSF